MKVEEYFFRYAYPCSEMLVKLGKLNKETKRLLDSEFESNTTPTKLELEEAFPAAFRRIKLIAKKMNKQDYWDEYVIKKYFREEHNNFIDANDGTYAKLPQSLKNICKVYVAEVMDVKDNILVVKYDHTERSVINKFLNDVKKGDKVTIHFGFAVEKI
jgi:NADPH-dependent ferric siderophore reductase